MAKKPESYPYLRIAKQFGIDYGVVLNAAHYIRFGDRTNKGLVLVWWSLMDTNIDVCFEITGAAKDFLDIQAGRVDWLTGERK